MKSTPIFVFDNKNSLLVNEVPIHGAIVVIDFDGVTKNITKLSNSGVTSSTTIEQFILMEDNWAFLGKPGELELIEENGKEGWRLYKRNEAHYGNIGLDAVDFNTTVGGYPLSGATGDRSFACGFNSHAMGEYSFSEGLTDISEVVLITGPIGGGGPNPELPEGAYNIYGVPEGAIVYYGVPEGAIVYYGVPEGAITYHGAPERDFTIFGDSGAMPLQIFSGQYDNLINFSTTEELYTVLTLTNENLMGDPSEFLFILEPNDKIYFEADKLSSGGKEVFPFLIDLYTGDTLNRDQDTSRVSFENTSEEILGLMLGLDSNEDTVDIGDYSMWISRTSFENGDTNITYEMPAPLAP